MPELLRAPLPYFGTVELWRAGLRCGGFAWLAAENYQRRSERNRCTVAGANGIQTLSIPLLAGKHERAPIRSVSIDYGQAWQRVHWGALRAGYGSAPFWDEYAPELEDLYRLKPEKLWDWNEACVEWVAAKLPAELVLAKAETWTRADARPQLTEPARSPRPYPQVFTERHGFLDGLSVLDLLLCQGPAAVRYLTGPH